MGNNGGLSMNACREVCRMEAQCKFYAHWDKKGPKGQNKNMANACFLYKGNCVKKEKLYDKNKNELWQIIRTTTTTTLATTTPDPDATTAADVASAVGDPHISTVSGEKYDLSKPGHVELMTIPAGASSEDALLKVTGETEKMGSRQADLWIRQVHVEGRWLDGDDFSFKTGHAKFGEAKLPCSHVRWWMVEPSGSPEDQRRKDVSRSWQQWSSNEKVGEDIRPANFLEGRTSQRFGVLCHLQERH